MNYIVRTENLEKVYGNNKVIKGITLNIEEGQMVTIIGQSGSGKSTLLYLLSGLEQPSSGKVFFNDRLINNLSDKEMSDIRKKEIGFIFQFYNLIDNLSVLDNIMFPIILNGTNKKEARQKALDYAKIVGLDNKVYSLPHELSGGEQQRVSIARALSINPKIIFADEPTGNLDSKMGIEIMELLKKINKDYNTTIIMVTHNNDLLKYFDYIIHIKDGKGY
ncbi:MAG: ABC transporter ATP-binding protein [Acholeplasmatales bacterium]|nr:ABC transporter ATP-binding protein [Acholeplasmatales bacterium]